MYHSTFQTETCPESAESSLVQRRHLLPTIQNITKVKWAFVMIVMNTKYVLCVLFGTQPAKNDQSCKIFFVFDGIEFCKHSVLENLVRLCITLTRFSVILIAK